MKNITKTLSKKETKLVKGGGWMQKTNKGRGWGCNKNAIDDGGCPPPDPTDD